LDITAKEGSAPMTDVWGKLFDPRKVTGNNVNYLIERLVKMQRLDLAKSLQNYCPLPFSLSAAPSTETTNQAEQCANISDFFTRIDP
jgi:hypothetical protein